MTYDPPSGPFGPDPTYQQWQRPAQPGYGQSTQPQYGQPPAPQFGQPAQPYSAPPVDQPYSAPPVPSPGPSYPPPAFPTSGPGYPQPGYPVAPQPPRNGNTGLIIALVVVILVVICGGGIAVFAVAASKKSGPTTAATGGPRTPAAGALAGAGTVAFGASVEWKDHLQAVVLSAAKFTPSATAAGTHSGEVGVKVTVKITNNSAKQLDLALTDVKLKSGPNGTQADSIIDLENNIELGFSGAVAPGHAATAVYAFSVPPANLGKLDVEVAPGFDYDSGIFEGAAT
jgi:flagellar basal body-associated protein FliL